MVVPMVRLRRFSEVADEVDRLKLLETLGRYSRFVSVSKMLLVALTLLLLATVVVLPLMRGDASGMRIAFTATEETEASKPVMINPRFQGEDNKGQPYLVTAEAAVQPDKNTIDLSAVSADMTFKDQSWMLVNAKRGRLNLDAEELQLDGDIKLFHDGGYEMSTERVLIDLGKSQARGDTPLQGQSAMGSITAGSFSAFDRGSQLVFHGPVKVVIIPGAQQ